uniref:Uncharacterized protein n=1 Tax=Meloidogyne enterolobii TaxID=390850 RepID=A0A6V7VGA0_MELEN|nr:unnamed protein product [Meloidogyne enterolobii]
MRCQPFRGKYQQECIKNPSSISQNGKYSAGSSFVSDNIYNYGEGEKDDEKMDDDDGWLSKDTQNLNKNKSANSSSSPFNNQKSLSPTRDSLLEKSKNFNEKIFENNFVEEKDDDTDTEPGEIPTDFNETNKLNNGELSFFENDGPDNLDKDIIWLIGGGKRVESSKTVVGNNKNINMDKGRFGENESLEEVDSWFSKDCQNKSQTFEDNSQNIGKKLIKEKEKQKEIILLDDKEEEESVELISNDGTEPADILILNNFIEEIDNSVGNGQKEHERMEESDGWLNKEDYQNKSQTLEDNLNSKNIEEHPKQVEEKEINEKEDEIMEEGEDDGWLSKDSGQSLAGKSKTLIEEENTSKSIENTFSPLKNFIQQKVFEQQEQSQKTKKLIEDSDFLIIEKPMSPLKNFIIQQEEQTKINEKINETPILNNKEDENKDDDDILTEPGEIPPSDCETEPGEIPPSDNESFGSTEPGELPLSDFEEEEEKINNFNLNNDWIIEKDERRENNTKCSETVIIIRMGIL